MSLAIHNTDKLASLRQEASRSGIRVLPPAINHSAADFTVEQDGEGLAIRYALAAIKRVGRAAMEQVAAARGSQAFASLTDFAERIDPRQLSKAQIETLARAGVFDELDDNRARLFAGAETVLRHAQARVEEAGSGQIGLFGGERPALALPRVADWEAMERLGYEAEAVGFHLTAHPLDSYGPLLARLRVTPSNRLEQAAEAGLSRIKLAGCVVGVKERPTRTGSRMAWVTLSDAAGSTEITLFSEVLARVRELLAPGTPLLATADLRREGEALRITVVELASLDRAAAEAGGRLRVWLDREAALGGIRAILQREGAGRGRVSLIPMLGVAEEVEVALPGAWRVTPRLAQALKSVQGVARVEEG